MSKVEGRRLGRAERRTETDEPPVVSGFDLVQRVSPILRLVVEVVLLHIARVSEQRGSLDRFRQGYDLALGVPRRRLRVLGKV